MLSNWRDPSRFGRTSRALAALAASGTTTSVDGHYVIGRPDRVRRDVLAGWPLLPDPDDDDDARGLAGDVDHPSEVMRRN